MLCILIIIGNMFGYFIAIPTLLEFKTEGLEKREVELQESERNVYEKRNREGNWGRLS
jgi:Sec-independent protein secretion pathway component TatC